jgi:biopolymer transport protein ExbD
MRFRASRNDEPELNLVPLIDVMLMTLIFLVITTSFSREAQLQIHLPEAISSEKNIPFSLRVAVNAKGQFFIKNQQLLNSAPDALRHAMAKAVGDNKDPVIIIHADARTPHESVVRVLDTARRLGYSRVTFATQQPTSQSP